MPRRKKSEAESPPAAGGNSSFKPDQVKSYVARIENLHADISKIMMGALSECKAVHGDIKEVYQEAKDEVGLPKKELKRVVKARALERKAAEVREGLEAEEQDNFDRIRLALGDLADTPLGQAVTRQTFNEKVREPGAPLDPSMADPPFAAPPSPVA